MTPRARRWIPALTLAVAALDTRDAAAQALQRFAVFAEGGGGYLLSSAHREGLGLGATATAGARLAFSIVDPLAVQLAYTGSFFPSDRGLATSSLIGAGLRVQPRLGAATRLWFDANAGAALTGDFVRLGLDVGAGALFDLAPAFGIGPMVRYSHVVPGEGDQAPHALWLTGGVVLSLRVPPPPTPAAAPTPVTPTPPEPSDRDGDGVLDPADACVTVPAGAHADPSRPGCPRPDRDRDGVFDDEDRCAETPMGPVPDPRRRGCPDGDQDHDGILDSQDQCPEVPAGDRRDPERLGCPVPDRDGDTVPDPVDRCPDQPGAPAADPARHGCPGLVRVENGRLVTLQPVFFAPNRDRILPRSFSVLTAVADALRASPQVTRVLVGGHTDDAGNDARNLALSERRAQSVLRWLSEHGVEPSRLTARGFGETRPVTPVAALRGRALRDARAQNRRVEFVLNPSESDR
jgi:outer membrane protein OmpA-like peptidoglycan-associated protein